MFLPFAIGVPVAPTKRMKTSLLLIIYVLFGLARADAQERPSPISPKPANLRQRLFGVPHSPGVKTAIRLAESLTSVNSRYRVVSAYMNQNATSLPLHSAIKLANTMYLGPARDAALAMYLRANSRWLTAREATKIADNMLLGPRREAALVSFATANKGRLVAKDLRVVADKFFDPRNRDALLAR